MGLALMQLLYMFILGIYSPDGADYYSRGFQANFSAGQTTATVTIPIIDDIFSELSETFFSVLTIPANASSLGVSRGDTDIVRITIIDNDPVYIYVPVNFNPTQYTVNEGDVFVTVNLTAKGVASFDYTVEVLTQDGTATGKSE